MARNEEKALTLFSKWTSFKKDFHSGVTTKRPFLASECESVGEAEKWRRELIRDVTRKISQIQNASLGEHRIREMNDEINKMMRQKHHWEGRIRELGGEAQRGRQFIDIEGKELPGAPGYKYYGAAKELPGVRELFAEKDDDYQTKRSKRTRGDLYKNITPDYYGYRDDDDGLLAAKETKREKELLAKATKAFQAKKSEILTRMKTSKTDSFTPAELAIVENNSDEDEGEHEIQQFITMNNHNYTTNTTSNNSNTDMHEGSSSASTNAELKSHVHLPSQEEIADMLLVEKRKALLAKLSSL